MISKSTKRKNRLNKRRLLIRESVSMHLIDKRVAFYIVSVPINPDKCIHHECKGHKTALKILRKTVSDIR